MSIKTYNLIKSIGCKTINAWSINVNNKSYIITPAHNLIYQTSITESTSKSTSKTTNKSWIKSNFTDSSDIKYFQKEYDNKWYVMKKYINTKSPLYDLAFIEIDKNYMKTINLDKATSLSSIPNANFYFYQSYDYKGDKTNDFSLGQLNGILYKSPTIDYYECLNVGFRGMSGSIVTNKNKCIGIFIRTGTNLGVNKSDSTIEMDLLKINAMRRGLIMPSHKIIEIIKLKGSNDLTTFEQVIV